MSRSDQAGPRSDPSRLTEKELQQLAERMADHLLSSSAAPLRQGFSTARRNPAMLKLAAEALGFQERARDTRWLIEFGNALTRKNRGRLQVLIKDALVQDPPTFDQAQRLGHFDSRAVWRKGLLGAAELFKGERGIPAKIETTEYSALAELGDQLAPACEKILMEYEANPGRSIAKIVEECRTEFAEAGTFLVRHIERLKSALEDPKLLSRARKFDTRARLLADVMAGAEYDLTLRTSIERARTGRRRSNRANL